MLNKTENQQFIRDLVGSIQMSLIESVDRIPDEWDGHEIRQLIADKFAEQMVYPLKGKRRVQYKNAVLTKNLRWRTRTQVLALV